MRRTPDELKDVLRFIGDNWAGDDADACHEAITLIAALESRLALAERVVEAAEAIDADFLHDDDPKAPEGGAFWVGQQRSLALRTALTAYRKETT